MAASTTLSLPDSELQSVLEFWFGPDLASGSNMFPNVWFVGSPELDQEIQARFESLLRRAAGTDTTTATATTTAAADEPASVPAPSPLVLQWRQVGAQGRLGLCLLFDQFARNSYRGSSAMYAFDRLAQREALELLEQRLDRTLPAPQRLFVYFALAHAEELSLVERAQALFAELADDATLDAHVRSASARFVEYVEIQARTLRKFGRLPYRNSVLERVNTIDEDDYVALRRYGFIAAVQEKPSHGTRRRPLRPNATNPNNNVVAVRKSKHQWTVEHLDAGNAEQQGEGGVAPTITSSRTLGAPTGRRLRIVVFHSFRQVHSLTHSLTHTHAVLNSNHLHVERSYTQEPNGAITQGAETHCRARYAAANSTKLSRSR